MNTAKELKRLKLVPNTYTLVLPHYMYGYFKVILEHHGLLVSGHTFKDIFDGFKGGLFV